MYGLVLEGGGARGGYQIGACKALMEIGFEIGMVAGTSVGALNGAMVVQENIEKAYDVWYEMSPDRVIKLEGNELGRFINSEFKPDMLKPFLKGIRKVISEGGLNVDPLVDLVYSVLDEDLIRKSPIGFGVVTVDITKRRAVEIYKEDIPSGQLLDYVIASASFPAFKRAVIDGRTFIDGGLYNVLPIDMVSSKGYKDIIVIRTYGLGLKKHIDTSGINIISISPADKLNSTMDFSNAASRKNLQMGYYDAYKAVKKLKGLKYYIIPTGNDVPFISYLANLDDQRISNILHLAGINNGGRRALFEDAIPKIAAAMGLPQAAMYEDVFIAFLERLAETLDVERFRFYTFDEFYNSVVAEYKACKEKCERPLTVKSHELLSKAMREKMLNSIANEMLG
jgi:NTE family protein